MKKRKMSAHINIGLAQVLKNMVRALQKDFAIIDHAKFMREALGMRRRQRRRMWLYLERKEKYNEEAEKRSSY